MNTHVIRIVLGGTLLMGALFAAKGAAEVCADVPAFVNGISMEYRWKSMDEDPRGTVNAPDTRLRSEEYREDIPQVLVVTNEEDACDWSPADCWYGDGRTSQEYPEYCGDILVDTTLPFDVNCEDLHVYPGVTYDTAGFVVRVCGTLTNEGEITDWQSGGEGGPPARGDGQGADPYAGNPCERGMCGHPGGEPSVPQAGKGGGSGSQGSGGGGVYWLTDDVWDADGGWCDNCGGAPQNDKGEGGRGGDGGGYVRVWAFNIDNTGHIHADGKAGYPGGEGGDGEYTKWWAIIWHDLCGGGQGGGAGGEGGKGGTLELRRPRPNDLLGLYHAAGGEGGLGGQGGSCGLSEDGDCRLDYGVEFGGSWWACTSRCCEDCTPRPCWDMPGCNPCGGEGGDGEYRENYSCENGGVGDDGCRGPDGTATAPVMRPGDIDKDGDEDEGDYYAFVDCYDPPNGGPVSPGCEVFDFDCDGDIDPDDWEAFKRAWTGLIEDIPTDACCFRDPVPDCLNLHVIDCYLAGGTPLYPNTVCLGDPDGDGIDDVCDHKMHFPQLPDESGWDVGACGIPFKLADDWRCIESGPVNGIQFWGSWKGGLVDELAGFQIAIHADVPDPDGDGPLFSMPGEELWSRHIGIGDFTGVPITPPDPQDWYDPRGLVDPDDHLEYFEYSIRVLSDPFIQVVDSVYWLAIEPIVRAPYCWGWKSSADHWNDAAVWSAAATGFEWMQLREPLPPEDSLDFAFVLCFVASAPLPDYSLPDMGHGTKNQYMTFRGGDASRSQAARVTFASLRDEFAFAEGRTAWVQEPYLVTETSGSSGGNPPNFWVAELGCTPYYTDWTVYDRVDVIDAGIVPDGVYEVQILDSTCSLNCLECYSEPLEVRMSRAGDIVGDCSVQPCSPPQGVVDFVDISACVEKFKNSPGAPRKARCDVTNSNVWDPLPDKKVDFVDISCIVAAFRGDPCPITGPPTTDPCGPSAKPTTELPSSDAKPLPLIEPVVITLEPSALQIRPGGLVEVDAYVVNVHDLRAYQLSLTIKGGNVDELTVEDLRIDGDRADYVFASTDAIAAVDRVGKRLGAKSMEDGVTTTDRVYLGTFVLRASSSAKGRFNLGLCVDDGSTFFRASALALIPFPQEESEFVTIEATSGLPRSRHATHHER